MSLYTVPCTPNGASAWTQVTALDGVEFRLTFTWNQRAGHWSLSIADQAGVMIRSGITLVPGMPLLAEVPGTARPRGELVVVDTAGRNDVDPGFNDLGGRFQLVYFAAEGRSG